MELFYLTKKEELDSVVSNAADKRGAEFLESWYWGELAQSEKVEIFRIGVRSETNILAVATIMKHALTAGYSYWYAPRGPIFSSALSENERSETEGFLYAEIKKIEARALFFRIEPKNPPARKTDGASEAGFKIKKTLDLQPRETLILDLLSDEEELLKNMHQKTRYNINLALKKGVLIREGGAADFDEFWRLMSLTGERDAFRFHAADHYRNLLSASADNPIKLYFASFGGKDIAAGLFCFWGDKVTYMHGASDNDFRNVMAPYLLQWSVIKQAQAEGYKYYDFYGISARKWPGVTRFKLGFGGRVETYPGTYDVIFRPRLYGCYGLIRKIRRLIK